MMAGSLDVVASGFCVYEYVEVDTGKAGKYTCNARPERAPLVIPAKEDIDDYKRA